VVAVWAALVPEAHAQPEAAEMPVLLLAPSRSEAATEWAAVVRGLRHARLRAVQVADLPIDPVFAACRQASCAAEAAHAAGMPALLCAVRKGILELRWVSADEGVWTERAEIPRGGLPVTTAQLASRIVRRRALGARALLRVESRPAGALVLVDGKLAGLTPFEQAWAPGTHRVAVELEGYASQSTEAPLAAGDVHDVRFELQAQTAVAGVGATAAEPAVSNQAIGAALGIAALPLLISGANAFIDDGQCLSSRAGACTDYGHAGAPAAVLLGAGVVSLLGAAYFLVAQPIAVRVDVSPSAAGAGVRGRF
jgi:hypothetical protein